MARAARFRWIRPTLVVLGALGLPGCCEITTAALPAGQVDQPYAAMLESDWCGSGVWTLQSGGLPPGISLFADGRLTGTPNTAGTFAFTVAYEEYGDDGYGASTRKDLTIVVAPARITRHGVTTEQPTLLEQAPSAPRFKGGSSASNE